MQGVNKQTDQNTNNLPASCRAGCFLFSLFSLLHSIPSLCSSSSPSTSSLYYSHSLLFLSSTPLVASSLSSPPLPSTLHPCGCTSLLHFTSPPLHSSPTHLPSFTSFIHSFHSHHFLPSFLINSSFSLLRCSLINRDHSNLLPLLPHTSTHIFFCACFFNWSHRNQFITSSSPPFPNASPAHFPFTHPRVTNTSPPRSLCHFQQTNKQAINQQQPETNASAILFRPPSSSYPCCSRHSFTHSTSSLPLTILPLHILISTITHTSTFSTILRNNGRRQSVVE